MQQIFNEAAGNHASWIALILASASSNRQYINLRGKLYTASRPVFSSELKICLIVCTENVISKSKDNHWLFACILKS